MTARRAKDAANRPLSPEEGHLVRWMLRQGAMEAAAFLDQVEHAAVTPWRCPCGCASIELAINDSATPQGRMHILGDYVFDYDGNVSGVFIYEVSGSLAGIEVYALAGEAPQRLPHPSELRPYI